MKQIFVVFGLCIFISGISQEKDSSIVKKRIAFSGSYEGNGQWYTNDKNRGLAQDEIPLRSNNYLNLNVSYGRFSVNTQIESYQKEALLNFNPKYTGTNFGTYSLNYKSDKLDVNVGHFYEQFGSGLSLRSWEDRSIGINNAIRGGRVIYRPVSGLSLTALYGNQRTGFSVTKGSIFGANVDFDLKEILGLEDLGISYGTSFVNRYEKLPTTVKDFNGNTYVISNRISLEKGDFYTTIEHDYKSKDALLNNNGMVDYNFVKPGSAVLINLGYSRRGFGIDLNLRRLENMFFLAERNPEVLSPGNTSLNYNDKLMNYIPSLTKQHHSNLANIYVYQAQGRTTFQTDENILKFGEIGGQLDLFYEFKKGSALGGKYGTNVSLNVANWNNLKAKNYKLFDSNGDYAPDYNTSLLGFGERYFSEYSVEISKKLNSSVKGLLSIIHQYYNDQYIRGIYQKSEINATTLFAESTIIFPKNRSITISAEHLWADADRKNWIGGSLEYNHNENWSVFASDMYNYGFDNSSHLINNVDLFKIHFYNVGAAYKKNSLRIAANYGRQRGGLVCAGGVCRFVPPSTGLGLQISTSF